ncbi:MAG: type I-C CRISPR-associated protein Cas8c/Csd1 [Streptosporangiaceae bacterium]
MLLQRLTEYAERAREGEPEALPPPYYRLRPVRWAIQLQADGTPAVFRLTDRSDDEHPLGGQLAVPYVNRSGVRPPPMLLADDLRYVLGFAGDSERERADSGRRNSEFTALVRAWHDSAPDDPVAIAVASFFERGLHRELQPPPDSAKATDVAAIMLGSDWAHARPSAAAFWAGVVRDRKSSDVTGLCLVCGTARPLLGTIPEMVKAGAIPAGNGRGRDAALVSVNNPAQGRGGKLQLASAPVCDECGSTAMSGLNSLLADSTSRYRTADSVLTWWLRDGRRLPMMQWLNEPKPGQVEQFFKEFRAPGRRTSPGTFDAGAFCAVTLSVNQARVVVRDWLEVPLSEVQGHLESWDADHAVTGLWQDGPQLVPLWLLAASTGRWGTEQGQERYIRSFMPDGCERDLLLTALRGTPPPGYLLPHLMHRIRADRHVDLPRAALLRLILARSSGPRRKESYMTGLDPDLASPPYQCGRMFAVLEDIQRAALGRDVNTTIADKYLSAATAAPLAILTMLRKNANGHLRRIRRSSGGAYYALSARLDEVLAHITPDATTAGIPATLPLAGQAEFILGYHHQRAADLTAARARKQDTTPDSGDAR